MNASMHFLDSKVVQELNVVASTLGTSTYHDHDLPLLLACTPKIVQPGSYMRVLVTMNAIQRQVFLEKPFCLLYLLHLNYLTSRGKRDMWFIVMWGMAVMLSSRLTIPCRLWSLIVGTSLTVSTCAICSLCSGLPTFLQVHHITPI